jgi:hypothetical protein
MPFGELLEKGYRSRRSFGDDRGGESRNVKKKES